MSAGAYEERLARLCAEVVLLEPEGALGPLRGELDALADLAGARGDEHARAALADALNELEQAGTGDAASRARAFAALGTTLARLEDAALRGGEALDACATEAADPEVLAHYLAHHTEELARMEELVVALEAEDDPERARELGGMLHTLKGDSALVGFDDVAERCHALEDQLAQRGAHAAADELLGAIDAFRQRLAAARTGAHAGPVPRAPVGESAGRAGATGRAPGTVRVEATRLDLLVDRVGELVIAESMIGQCAELRALGSPQVSARLAQLEKITRELQGLAMSLRMVPLRATFQRMARLARDVARHLDKEVEFVVTGAETELDKTVVDAIADPLVHLVRNAVDHGVDLPDERRRRGKSAQARIELRAFQRAGRLCIELEDDGAGLDEEAILAHARRRGLVAADVRPESAAVRAMIFQPGFSTARVVTEVSGRGIGLDVVQRAIQALRGRIEVRSNAGHGTTFALSLPPTLAIIDGMLVRAGRQRFVLPTLSILHMLRLDPGQMHSVLGQRRMLGFGDALVPLHGLLERLEGAPPPSDEEARHVLVVEHEGTRLALRVDEILGQQQIVVKPMTSLHVARAGLAGGAVLPDGTVGLILDLGTLVSGAPSHVSAMTHEPVPS